MNELHSQLGIHGPSDDQQPVLTAVPTHATPPNTDRWSCARPRQHRKRYTPPLRPLRLRPKLRTRVTPEPTATTASANLRSIYARYLWFGKRAARFGYWVGRTPFLTSQEVPAATVTPPGAQALTQRNAPAKASYSANVGPGRRLRRPHPRIDASRHGRHGATRVPIRGVSPGPYRTPPLWAEAQVGMGPDDHNAGAPGPQA
jgi:hypothetical protein